MTDYTALIARLREVLATQPFLPQHFLSTLRDAADALEAAEKVIEPLATGTQYLSDMMRAAAAWRDKYGSGI